MQQDIGITVSDQVAINRDLDPTQPQWSSRLQPMRIVSDSDAELG